jgi:hypothetical protein
VTSSSGCSEGDLTPAAGLVVLEGMPGAGKTTAVAALAAAGACVLGEYTDASAATVDVVRHPAAGDDGAHQGNWLRKAAQCAALLDAGHPVVFADRDWLSSLAYAASVAGEDDGALLGQRAEWAAGHLLAGHLLLPAVYAVFDLEPAVSLKRRAARLRAGHPWADPAALGRLRAFYRDPGRALEETRPELTAALALPRRVSICGLTAGDRAAAELATAGRQG